jgi:hypothetical protein
MTDFESEGGIDVLAELARAGIGALADSLQDRRARNRW